jgi:ArsR family transcriptional regulator
MKNAAPVIEFPIPAENVSLAGLLSATGDAFRLQIIRALAQDSFSVSELCTIFGMRQSALSHHLKVLIDAGLLSRKKEMTTTFYRPRTAQRATGRFASRNITPGGRGNTLPQKRRQG